MELENNKFYWQFKLGLSLFTFYPIRKLEIGIANFTYSEYSFHSSQDTVNSSCYRFDLIFGIV